MNAEKTRLQQSGWKKWGPYLSERQWGTVREDYSANGDAWNYFSHDQARSRAYRWGEDGLAGISDDRQCICFAVALWNGKDPIIKERLFGLTGNEGNHGEDVKELYYYLDNTPTHSYMKHLYKYPQAAFPYDDLVRQNAARSRMDEEYEILDTGVFNQNRYFDVFTEYAKQDPEDMAIRITIHNRGDEEAFLALLPSIWLRNYWSFGLMHQKPVIHENGGSHDYGSVKIDHYWIGDYHFYFEKPDYKLFTENETNNERLFQSPNAGPYVKDSINDAVVGGRLDELQENKKGTRFAPYYHLMIGAGQSVRVKLRLSKRPIPDHPFDLNFDQLFDIRQAEADRFYHDLCTADSDELKAIQRQAFAGMLWSKQYYQIDMPRWLNGDPGQPKPPESRYHGRNQHWMSLNNEDVISMPDKWEYPWYAAWDLAFHCVPLSMVDPQFAKDQLILFLREWYMHPNGQLPAYEWAFSDVNPPVHAWSCLQVYQMDKAANGHPDIGFLKRAFQKLLINFTWWVNRKDRKGNNVFEGGFLGLDNIGIFDRSSQLPGGGTLEQADGTAWMAMYCLNMLEMALEISQYDENYEDVATKFLEHFVYIAESLNRIGADWTGSWDEEEGFFYDVLSLPDGRYIPLKVRSLVGLTTLFAVFVLKRELISKVPDFYNRLKWFRQYREENGEYQVIEELHDEADILLSLVPPDRLKKLLSALFDEMEFLSVGGIRSVSKVHEKPYSVNIDGQEFGLSYQPGESNTGLFGGNSNWRGPVWMPMNYLIVLALQKYASYYGDDFKVEYPTHSGNFISLHEASHEIAKRLVGIFQKDNTGNRPVNREMEIYRSNPHFSELILFYEYFHGDTARGVGASHQTGWTGVIAELINRIGSPSRAAHGELEAAGFR